MTLEVGADQFLIPGPAVLRIACGMNASKTTTGPDVALGSGLLAVIEDVARCQQKHDSSVAGKVGVCEHAGVFGGIDQITVLGSRVSAFIVRSLPPITASQPDRRSLGAVMG